MIFNRQVVVNALVAVLSYGLWGSGWASPVAFTSRAAFSSAVLQIPHTYTQTYSFEKDTNGNDLAGTLLPSPSAVPYGNGPDKVGMGIFYDFDATIKISNAYPTSSGSNFLGTTDGDIFQGGDNFLLTFAYSNAYAIGMYFISADVLLDDDIQLQVALGADLFTASLDASAVQRTLSDGSRVYFLGLVDSTRSFSRAFVKTDSNGAGNFLYNVDDIIVVIPEPPSILIAMTGLLLLAGFRRSWRSSCRNAEVNRYNKSGGKIHGSRPHTYKPSNGTSEDVAYEMIGTVHRHSASYSA